MPRKRKTDETFRKEVFELTGDDYTFLDDYVTSKIKIRVLHRTCGHTYEIEPRIFLKGNRCPECARNIHSKRMKGKRSSKKTDRQFKEEVYEVVGSEYSFLEEYKGSTKKIKIRHNNELCNNHTYEVSPNSFLSGGNRCPICSASGLKKTNQQFNKEVYEQVKDEYTFLDKYIQSLVKIPVRHNICGTTYKVAPSVFLTGKRCPKCFESKGEKAIAEYLTSNGYVYKPEFIFRDLKPKGYLRFDFAIADIKNNKIQLIEFDGEQHFKSVEGWGGAESFSRICHYDRLKNNYAKENNIPLLRIPYWEFDNIESLVGSFLETIQSKEVEVTDR